jgi:hypothetical protein
MLEGGRQEMHVSERLAPEKRGVVDVLRTRGRRLGGLGRRRRRAFFGGGESLDVNLVGLP